MSEWSALLMELGDHEPSFALIDEARERASRQGVPSEPPGRWRGRVKLGVAVAVGAAVIAAVLLVLALAAQSRSSNRPAHHPAPSKLQAVGIGEPVKLAYMTFVVKSFTVAPSFPILSRQPLKGSANRRLWMLTVTVRNDGDTSKRDPFCRGGHRLGAELFSRHYWYFTWLKESLLIDHDLCGYIEPGATETFQLLFAVPKPRGAIAGVMLGLRTRGSDHSHTASVRLARATS